MLWQNEYVLANEFITESDFFVCVWNSYYTKCTQWNTAALICAVEQCVD